MLIAFKYFLKGLAILTPWMVYVSILVWLTVHSSMAWFLIGGFIPTCWAIGKVLDEGKKK